MLLKRKMLLVNIVHLEKKQEKKEKGGKKIEIHLGDFRGKIGRGRKRGQWTTP